jgi:hypothetical protein
MINKLKKLLLSSSATGKGYRRIVLKEDEFITNINNDYSIAFNLIKKGINIYKGDYSGLKVNNIYYILPEKRISSHTENNRNREVWFDSDCIFVGDECIKKYIKSGK